MQSEIISRPSVFSGLMTWHKEYVRAAEILSIDINEMKALRLKGKNILLCRSERGFFALQDKCTYGRYALSEGVMINSTIQCLKHGCQYSVETGRVKKGPAKKDVKIYRTYVKSGYVYIEV